MKVYLLSLFSICLFAAHEQEFATYQSYLPDQFEEAITFLQTKKSAFTLAAKTHGFDAKVAMSIVAPEVSRYNDIVNYAEEHANRIFYVQLGSDYRNFSVGRFQMKPAFAEQIESYLCDHAELKSVSHLTQYSGETPQEIRSERLNRLSSFDGQLQYLSAFMLIMEQKTKSITFASLQEKRSYFATAYNCGFLRSNQKIKQWQQKAYFPNSGVGTNFPYANVANEFYHKL